MRRDSIQKTHIRALIAEDEMLGRRNLRDYLSEIDWIEAIGEAVNGTQALAMIDDLKPDLVFLDVRMPELSGLEVAEKMQHQPFIVFTTAYDQYAVSAFELEAVDYLLKPFSRKRFIKSLERIRLRLKQPHEPPLADRLAQVTRQEPFLDKIFVRKGSQITPVILDDVIHFQAAENYISVATQEAKHLIHLPMVDLEKRLDPTVFLRIHRSHIIHIHHIKKMEIFDERRLLVCLDNGEKVLASRSGSKLLKGRII